MFLTMNLQSVNSADYFPNANYELNEGVVDSDTHLLSTILNDLNTGKLLDQYISAL